MVGNAARLVLFSIFYAVSDVHAESHTLSITNDCGYGAPYLWGPNGTLYSSGETSYTFNGPAPGLYSYLQTGSCGANGEGCTVVNASLVNGDSCADIDTNLATPSDVAVEFEFYNGCDAIGSHCTTLECPIEQPVCCSADNVDLAITFCG
ncbi:hypothetical protein DAEQUDRAFT_732416 [Daedalea quercina L-15889]|uniref:Glycopeptide n=1 Tax=Daedalea quercina L-15889 TaxID=1314783 RepID=A0A165LLE5_9APHY|nr:hypothetical protein DAEQUDRAFT_732416 [Daedalea quercina L-15889]